MLAKRSIGIYGLKGHISSKYHRQQYHQTLSHVCDAANAQSVRPFHPAITSSSIESLSPTYNTEVPKDDSDWDLLHHVASLHSNSLHSIFPSDTPSFHLPSPSIPQRKSYREELLFLPGSPRYWYYRLIVIRIRRHKERINQIHQIDIGNWVHSTRKEDFTEKVKLPS